MKRIAAILSLFVTLSATAADLVVSNNAIINFYGDSFSIGGTSSNSSGYRTPDYIASYYKLNYPGSNISTYNVSRSGGEMIEILTNRVHPSGIPIWGYQSNNVQHIGILHGTDNGGLNVVQMFQQASNIMQVPFLMSDGDNTLVAHSGLVVSNVSWIGFGDPPGGSANGGYDANANNASRNNINIGVTNAGWSVGVRGVEAYYTLSNSWVTDYLANGGTNIQFIYLPAEHFMSGGGLAWAMAYLKGTTTDTNVSTATIDANTLTTTTNHCCVVSVAYNGITLSWTRKDDRLPFGFDMPDGTITNDCSGAFRLIPSDADYFRYTIQVTGLPFGNWTYAEDGHTIGVYTASQLAAGLNMFTNMTYGQTAAQRKEVLGRERDLEHVNRVTLIPLGQDGTGMIGYFSAIGTPWSAGNRGNALIAALNSNVANLFSLDALASTAALPTNHTYSLTLSSIVTATTATFGTTHWGQ